jgi:hypothetical protein
MDRVPLASLKNSADDWSPKLKKYPHFDAPLSENDILDLVTDPARVAKNTFYPFMRYEQKHQPFRTKKSGKPKKKNRPIRFASRRDSYIFAYYRFLLSASYERLLKENGVSNSVIAYRKLKQPDGSGKSNINFAMDAFRRIKECQNCAVVALDVASFFESLDHLRLKSLWCRVLGVESLPQDHAAVFKAITKYAVANRDDVYERLGFSAKEDVHGKERLVYKTKFKDMPAKLCSNTEFQQKICGRGGKFKSLIDVNRRPFGIPQGSPISDLLANVYLLDYDIAMSAYASEKSGFYYRYSDDIILIIPGGASEAFAAITFATEEIRKQGDRIFIKEQKTSALTYHSRTDGHQDFNPLTERQGRNGVEYLGFRFNGREVFFRDSTISNLYRKISAGIKMECRKSVSRYPGKDLSFLMKSFDYPALMGKYGRVKDFKPSDDVKRWTFWTYARRASQIFGLEGRPLLRQLRNFKSIVRTRVARDMEKALMRATQQT